MPSTPRQASPGSNCSQICNACTVLLAREQNREGSGEVWPLGTDQERVMSEGEGERGC